jgi:3-deoxy-D-manno-oct-2-ulosonic acid (Kdo) hydroxylase
MLEQFDLESWSGPFAPETRARAQAALERGAVLFFPHLAFRLANSEMEFLDGKLTNGKAKNISLDFNTGKLQGTSASGEKALLLAAMIERFGAGATNFVTDLLPNYAGVERARTSYRPVEVEGRAYSVIKDDRLLHVDAFPSRPMQKGRRILRFFANVAPPAANGGGSRRWQVGEPFEDFAGKFAPRLRPHPPGQSWLFEKLGVTRGKRSAYDEMMLSLHDAAKRDADYQKHSPHYAVEFPPGSCWLVYTDMVLHAALAGEFALEQTFHFDVAEMGEPGRAPIRVLERLTGKSLV